MTRHWQPGDAAFELLVHEDVIRICAWCERARTEDGGWIPLTTFVPSKPSCA